MTEQWKEIEGFSRYMVSPEGEVLDTKTNKLVAKQLAGKPQYYYVNVNRDDGKRKLKRVHRFVAEAYVEGRSEEYNIVDHIDRDKFNNHYTNLRWVDHSGNQRNREGNIYIFGEAVKDYTKRYENPEAAYTYLAKCLLEGMSDQEVVDKYQEHLDYGMKRAKVFYEDKEYYLIDLSKQLGIPYSLLRNKMDSEGNLSRNSVYNIPETFPYSFEIRENGVMYWYPSKLYFTSLYSRSRDVLRDCVNTGMSTEEILALDGKDYLRQTVRGVAGTVKELCEYFGVSESAVSTNMARHKMSLEEALFAPRLRVKRLSINGESNTPKYWYEYFGLNPKRVNNWKSKNSKTFKETLEHFGVDTSEMTFSEI